LVLDVLRAGRAERRAHADGLDPKAGLALGSAGLLATLRNDIAQPWRTMGSVAAVLAVGFALWSFWPRQFRTLDPAGARHGGRRGPHG
jgi:hypothetical protein